MPKEISTKKLIKGLEFLKSEYFAVDKVMPDDEVDEILKRLKDHDDLIKFVDELLGQLGGKYD